LTRTKFTVWIDESEIELIDFIFAHSNVSKFIKDLIDDFRKGKLVKIDELHKKKLETDIRYKEIMIEIKKKELLHLDTFDKYPSSQAKIAIKTAVNTESYEPPEEKKILDVIQNNWNKFVETIKQNSKAEWTVTCKLCSTGFILPTRDEAIQRFKIHLEQTHHERVLD